MLITRDYQLSLHYLLMTAVDGETQILLLSQLISAIAEEDNTGSYVCKWCKTNKAVKQLLWR